MASHLLTLPREIRERIYIYLLKSPTGYVCIRKGPSQRHTRFPSRLLHPTHHLFPSVPASNGVKCLSTEPIRLDVLVTCRQIHDEAQDVVFEHNIWAFRLGSTQNPLPESSRLKIRHLWISLTFTRGDNLVNTAHILETILRCSRKSGKLKTLTINGVSNSDEMKALANARRFNNSRFRLVDSHLIGSFSEYVFLLRCGKESFRLQSPNVVTKLNFTMRLVEYSETYELAILPDNAFSDTMKEMHSAWGDELWFNGKLCYKHGEEILRPFKKTQDGIQPAWMPPGPDHKESRANRHTNFYGFT